MRSQLRVIECVADRELVGDPEMSWGRAIIDGGDVLATGNGLVLIGLSEGASRQAIAQVAAGLLPLDP